MNKRQPRRGPGAFQWNAGGWFGSLIGGTAWLLAGALFFMLGDEVLAWIWAGCFALGLGTGVGLWWARHRLLPYPAMQVLLLVLFLGALIAFLAVDLRNQLGLLLPAALNNKGEFYVCLLVFPGLMLRFYIMERRVRQHPREEPRSHNDSGADTQPCVSHVER